MLLKNVNDNTINSNNNNEISSDDNFMDSSSSSASSSDFFRDSGAEFYVAFSLTTWGAGGENLGNDEAEIVHTAWAIVDGKTGMVHSTHGSFIKPDDFSKITWENVEKHHICESDVRNAADLGQVILQFDSHVNALIYGRQADGLFNGHQRRRVVLVVDNPLTVRQVLHPEAARKGLRLPDYYWSFLNLKRWDGQNGESEDACNDNEELEEGRGVNGEQSHVIRKKILKK
uniref:Uncharacterized protein n=1 Tax=Romanomermis culicivorax TaxID=13658 RepID=A0A915KCC5_ROMCU